MLRVKNCPKCNKLLSSFKEDYEDAQIEMRCMCYLEKYTKNPKKKKKLQNKKNDFLERKNKWNKEPWQR